MWMYQIGPNSTNGNIGNIVENEWYWSSSEFSGSYGAMKVLVSDGSLSPNANKSSYGKVRPIRSF